MTEIYIARIREDAVLSAEYPPERVEEIRTLRNPSLIAAKITTWNTLRCAIETSLHRRMEDYAFRRHPYGGWRADGLFFSLSHAGSLAAVAISDHPVGIDLEDLTAFLQKQALRKQTWQRLAEMISTPDELPLCDTPELFLSLWTRKEAVFKASDLPAFLPSKTDTLGHSVRTFYRSGDPSYLCSICTEASEEPVFHLPQEDAPAQCWIPLSR